MHFSAEPASNDDILPLRVRYRAEASGQITKDSIHRRTGWTTSFLLSVSGIVSGFGSIAIAGPWKDKPTVFEFYVLPEKRGYAFALFEAFVAASAPRFFEVQTSDTLLAVMLHTYGYEIASESIVFRDELMTALPGHGAELKRVTSVTDSQRCFELRQGGSEWTLELGGQVVATGGIMFHYNHPYGDIYMETAEAHRRRGFGAYFVQELKRVAYEMGGIPGARCNVGNIASRLTLQKAGFVPFSHILVGKLGKLI